MNFFSRKSKGFTLIEVIIAITISMGVVLLVSYSLKFFVNSWDKTKKIFLVNQKYLFLNSLMETELISVLPFQYNGKIFFKGANDYLVFITQNSGTVYPSINEVGYYFQKDKNQLTICFHGINNANDIVDYEILKEEGECINFDNINLVKFEYSKNNEDIEEIDGEIPVKINIDLSFILDENDLINKSLSINYYEQ